MRMRLIGGFTMYRQPIDVDRLLRGKWLIIDRQRKAEYYLPYDTPTHLLYQGRQLNNIAEAANKNARKRVN